MDTPKLLDAIQFAAEYHKDQRRKGNGGSPYINHLIEVVALLSKAHVTDTNTLIAAVLHDMLEDTLVSENEISSRYGDLVLSYVKALTDDKTLSLEKRRSKQVETIKKSGDHIKSIKLADHCSNIASLPPSWDKERLTSYLSWSEKVAQHCFHVSETLADEYKRRFNVALRFLDTI